MEGEKTFAHPALCPLEALCATANGENTWTCQSNYAQDGISMPAKCDAKDDPIMLWGRQTRATSENATGNAACTDDSMCQDAVKSKCYAHQCVSGETSGDDLRNWVYINGACATISPHAVAEESVTSEQITIQCLINTENGDIDVDRHYPNRYNDVVHGGHDFFDDMLVNRYGQIVPDADFDESTLPVRAFDTRAKAQACMLCSLYTARNPDKVAYIKDGEFAKCTMYAVGVSNVEGEKCVDIFGDNIFVAREGYKEVETLDPEDERPAYLLSGMVPTDMTKGWTPFGLMPPLFKADGIPYLDSPLQKHLMPQFGGIYESFNSVQRQYMFKEPSKVADWNHAGEYLKRTANFALLWDFVSCATREDYSPTKAYDRDKPETAYPADATIFYRPDFQQIWYAEATPINNYYPSEGYQKSDSLVPPYLCRWQASYCCPTGVDMGEIIEWPSRVHYATLRGKCGYFNTLSYGLNHPYRATRCEKYDGNVANPNEDDVAMTHYNSLLQTDGTGDTEGPQNLFAADVLVVPRTYDTTNQIYGWARDEDLYDVDRTATTYSIEGQEFVLAWNQNGCKYRPGKRDYCLRRDRGRGSSTKTPLNSYCHQRGQVGFNLMATEEPEAICTNAVTDAQECLAYVKGETVSSTTMPTTSPTPDPGVENPITPRDAMLYFTIVGKGGAHMFDRENSGFSWAFTKAWPARMAYDTDINSVQVRLNNAMFYNAQEDGNTWKYSVHAAEGDVARIKIYDFATKSFVKDYDENNTYPGNYVNAVNSGYIFTNVDYLDQRAPIYVAFEPFDQYVFEMAVMYPVGMTRAACGVYYRYRPVAVPENLLSYSYADAALSAHTGCRDFCTAWHDCIAYSFNKQTCKLYFTFTNPADRPSPFTWFQPQPDYVFAAYYKPYSTFWEWTINAEQINTDQTEKDAALVEHLAANVKREKAFDSDALHRDTLPATRVTPDDDLPGAFDLYYGFSFCDADRFDNVTRRGRTLQQCIYEAGARNDAAFVWYGRLDSCLLYSSASLRRRPIRVANAEPLQPNGPIAKCPNYVDLGYGDNYFYNTDVAEIGVRELREGQSIPVLGARSDDSKLTCPQTITTTTTTKTVASLAPVGVEKAAYGIDQRLCGTDEPRWIYPVFERSEVPDANILSTSLEVEGHDLVVDTARGFIQPCPETQPDGFVLVNAPNETTATSTPGTAPTTTTRTFVNEFTEADTAVTIGVVAGVLGTGVILIALRVLFPAP